MTFTNPFILLPANLVGTNGFVSNGVASGDAAGSSVSGIGDINGDGIDDFLVGAPTADSNGTSSGTSYVLFGSTSVGAAGPVPLNSLNGTNGFKITGPSTNDLSGFSVGSAGDVNGDNHQDLIIGARTGAFGNPGTAYVIFGSTTVGSSGTVSLNSLNGTNGFAMNGQAKNDNFGYSVGSAGDFNQDGIDDIIISAVTAERSVRLNAGVVYVVFGKTNIGAGGILNMSLDGTNGFEFRGNAANDKVGTSVASGDINNDGIPDLIVGAKNAIASTRQLNQGITYVIFGGSGVGSSGAIESHDILILDDYTIGIPLIGPFPGTYSGTSVSSGDVNGDNIDDVVIGTPFFNYVSSGTGAVHVFFGGTGSIYGSNLLSLDGTDGFVLYGTLTSGKAGTSVAAVDDFNGDAISDILIGTPNVNGSRGISYMVFGSSTLGSTGSVLLSSLDGANGFQIQGNTANEHSGSSVAAAGDINGDHVTDILIGARTFNGDTPTSGGVFILFGTSPPGTINLVRRSTINDQQNVVFLLDNDNQTKDQKQQQEEKEDSGFSSTATFVESFVLSSVVSSMISGAFNKLSLFSSSSSSSSLPEETTTTTSTTTSNYDPSNNNDTQAASLSVKKELSELRNEIESVRDRDGGKRQRWFINYVDDLLAGIDRSLKRNSLSLVNVEQHRVCFEDLMKGFPLLSEVNESDNLEFNMKPKRPVSCIRHEKNVDNVRRSRIYSSQQSTVNNNRDAPLLK
jgi:hypothetical protein